ncbi:MAG: CRISPR-associated endoribonuclease Cas6 [Nitrososphaeria archaeon]
MRLLLSLESEADAAYDRSYYHKLQGFIYNHLRETPYSTLHNKKGYKFFCFSNIFPIGDIKQGDKRQLLISSPNEDFIKTLAKQLTADVNIGDMHFKLKEMKPLDIKLGNNVTIITATPLIFRIPKRNFSLYGIESNKPYVFWMPSYSVEALIKQIEDNIFKKYKEFYNLDIDEFPIFDEFRHIKSVVSHVIVKGREEKWFGNIFEFKIYGLRYNPTKRKVLKFAIDCGLGERNTFGFGFGNVV